MNRVTIHIGLPKTATTTLQQKVFASHPGIFYLGPKANYLEFDKVMNGLCGADGLNYDPELGLRVIERLLAPAKHAGKPCVVSHEAISAQGRDRRLKAERLKALFPDARIVLTVRRPEDLLVSVYLQWLKGFGDKRFEAPSLDLWLERDWQGAGRGNFLRLQYEKLLELYRSLFGRMDVLLLFFEDLIDDRGKFARQLSDFIDVDSQMTDDLLSQDKVNARMSALRYSEVRLYSSFPFLRSLDGVKRLLPGSLRSFVKKRFGSEVTQKLSPKWRQKIRDYAKAENQGLQREFREIAKYDYY
jgi:hypothetical protein